MVPNGHIFVSFARGCICLECPFFYLANWLYLQNLVQMSPCSLSMVLSQHPFPLKAASQTIWLSWNHSCMDPLSSLSYEPPWGLGHPCDCRPVWEKVWSSSMGLVQISSRVESYSMDTLLCHKGSDTTYTMEYYVAIKRTHTTMQMNLVHIHKVGASHEGHLMCDSMWH